MLADDLGYGEPGCYGNPQGRTPNLDRLAANGARFTNGYAASNVCSPSRAALMTGRYMQRLGPLLEDYFGGPAPGLDPKKDLTLARMAKDAGYATGCFGKWNVSHNKTIGRIAPNAFGFDRWVGLHLNHNYYTQRLGEGEDLYRVASLSTGPEFGRTLSLPTKRSGSLKKTASGHFSSTCPGRPLTARCRIPTSQAPRSLAGTRRRTVRWSRR